MKISFKWRGIAIILAGLLFLYGCATYPNSQQLYSFPDIETEWIRDGQPLEFEDERWYPTDRVENLLDNEVYLLGEYRGVQFFVDKTDVRPFERLYTKFGGHKFRVFEKKGKNDKG